MSVRRPASPLPPASRGEGRPALVALGRSEAYLLLLSGICLVTVAALMVLVSGNNVLSIDVRVGRWLQSLPLPFGESIAAFGNAAGSGAVGVPVVLTVVALLAIGRRRTDAVFLLGLVLAKTLNGPLKDLASSPRPDSSFLHVTEDASGLGFPSGHAMGAVLLAGGLAYLAWSAMPGRRIRPIPWVAAVAVIIATGYGRIYTGAHWPTDVLGGFLSGGFILLLAILLRRLVVSSRSGPRPERLRSNAPDLMHL